MICCLHCVLICVNPPVCMLADGICLTAICMRVSLYVCVLHMLDSFFKQYQVHDSVQLIIMLQSISQCLLEFLPV